MDLNRTNREAGDMSDEMTVDGRGEDPSHDGVDSSGGSSP